MAEGKYLSDTLVKTVINDDATLANNTRAAADYDNGTELDLFCDVFLQVQWDSTLPSAGALIGELWVLPSQDDDTTFPEGGDAGLGTDDDPQDVFRVGGFVTVNPSLSVNEVLCLPAVPLYPHDNRFVFKNVSGGVFDATWELRIVPHKYQSV